MKIRLKHVNMVILMLFVAQLFGCGPPPIPEEEPCLYPVFGCGSPPPISEEEPCLYPDDQTAGAPSWICKLPQEKFAMAALGIGAPNPKTSIQQRNCQQDGRRQLAEGIKSNITSSYGESFRSYSEEKMPEELAETLAEGVSNIVASEILRGSFSFGLSSSKERKTMYCLMAIKSLQVREIEDTIMDNINVPGIHINLYKTLLVDGLEKQRITYADYKSQMSQVKLWLKNEHSGYPSLYRTLKKIVRDRCPIGTPVPLTTINGKYLEGAPPVMEHDPDKLKTAYIKAWKEKNSRFFHLTTLENIAPVCGDSR